MNTTAMSTPAPRPPVTSQEWFAGGERRAYHPPSGSVLAQHSVGPLTVWERIEPGTDPRPGRWITMLPGFPDGSYGFAKVDAILGQTPDPRLYVEYLGHGDSDKPRGVGYSTAERADLVTALWRDHDVTETIVVAFDYSTLVVLELLARRLEGTTDLPRITIAQLSNGGLFTDAHSHPWYSTPLMGSWLGRSTRLIQHAEPAFRTVLRHTNLYSKQYPVSAHEEHEWYTVMSRRNGMFILHDDARFVRDHQAQGERLDFGRLYRASRDHTRFVVTGAVADVYEGRQTIAARDRLGPQGLDVRFHPGGHLTTHEHPELLANIIREISTTRPHHENARDQGDTHIAQR